MENQKVIKVPHISRDGSWVEFHGMSQRQEEILKAYKTLYTFTLYTFAVQEFEIDKKK